MEGGRAAYSSGDTMLGEVLGREDDVVNIDESMPPMARGGDVDNSSSDESQRDSKGPGGGC